jgi:WD40 repeat protein
MPKKVLMVVLLAILALGALTPAALAQDAGGRLLVWVSNGAGPDQVEPTDPGQLVFMAADGTLEPVLDVPQQTSRVTPCGEDNTSPDGSRYAFYVGGDDGALYMMNNSDAPVLVDNVRAMTCAGGGTFRFSPDGARFAFISFEAPAQDDEFSDGRLRIYDTETMERVALRENDVVDTAAFDISNDGVVYIRLPQVGDRREATEGVVNFWNGSATLPIATLRPDTENNCRWTSANLGVLPDSQIVAVMGHRCRSGDYRGTSYRVFLIDPSTRDSYREIVNGQTPGSYFPTSRLNQVVVSNDGSTVFFTSPDGVTRNTTALYALDVAAETVTTLLERSMVVTELGASAYQWTDPGILTLSPDSRWLAFVEQTPDNDQSLFVLDLDNPTAAPIELPAGARGSQVSSLVFAPDSSRLFYLSGGDGFGTENSLNVVELATGASVGVTRGRFGPFVTSPDGSQFAVMEWQTVEKENEPPYLTLSLFDGQGAFLGQPFIGGEEDAEGNVINQRFAYPLAWRPG